MTSMTVMPTAVTMTIATKTGRVIFFKMLQQKGKVLYKLGIDENYMYSLTPRPISAHRFDHQVPSLRGQKSMHGLCYGHRFLPMGILAWLMDYVSINNE